MSTLSATISLALAGVLAGSADLEDVKSRISAAARIEYSNGTGSGQAQFEWSDRRTLASNTAESLDLVGALTDALGATFSPTKIKALIIVSDAANTTALTIGNVTNGITAFLGVATNYIVLQAGGLFVIADPVGFTLTASTADLLKVANAAGAAATYEIYVIGA
jgi:hypothetical protein